MSNRDFKDIEKYINEAVAAYATQIDNVESVKCERLVDKVYMEIIHEDSTTRYFDISSLDISKIGILVGYIVSNIPVSLEVKDRLVKKEIRKLFK